MYSTKIHLFIKKKEEMPDFLFLLLTYLLAFYFFVLGFKFLF
ncbi:hypothetical protein PIN17_A1471 [Prevotella intermedia 17]|nr:hypothetical protein PIN17_A1471 [Prevotella intermedia 17]